MNGFISITNSLRKYATFTGRAPAPEFWWGLLGFFAVLIVGLFIDDAHGQVTRGQMGPAGLLLLPIACPMLALTVRRLHDLDRTGWWALALWGPGIAYTLPMVVVPAGLGDAPRLLGGVLSLLVLYWTTHPGKLEANRFGPPPLTCFGSAP